MGVKVPIVVYNTPEELLGDIERQLLGIGKVHRHQTHIYYYLATRHIYYFVVRKLS